MHQNVSGAKPWSFWANCGAKTPGVGVVVSIKVLFAEDEPSVRKLVVDILLYAGFEYRVASDGQEALEMFQSDPEWADVLLTDYSMPRLNGYGLAISVRKLRPSPPLPVVFLSGETWKLEKVAEELGATVVSKPPSVAQVIDAINEQLANTAESVVDHVEEEYSDDPNWRHNW